MRPRSTWAAPPWPPCASPPCRRPRRPRPPPPSSSSCSPPPTPRPRARSPCARRRAPTVRRLLRLEAVDDELQQPAAAAQRAEQRELGHARPHDALAVGVARVDLRHEIARDAALAVDLNALDVVVRGLAVAEVEHAGRRVQRVPPEVAVPRREGRHSDEPESQGRRGGLVNAPTRGRVRRAQPAHPWSQLLSVLTAM
eukprot:scaffold48971_cov66-Phaeocystis_antarctica.AAC.5